MQPGIRPPAHAQRGQNRRMRRVQLPGGLVEVRVRHGRRAAAVCAIGGKGDESHAVQAGNGNIGTDHAGARGSGAGIQKTLMSTSCEVMNSSSTGTPFWVCSMPRLIAGMISAGSVTRSP